jgi:LuxR family transcriptional regulator, maltose regulon positive regulatory protein
MARLWAGDLDAADRALAAATDATTAAGLDLAAAEVLGGRALVQALRGRLDEAAELAALSVHCGETAHGGRTPYATLGSVVLGLVHGLRGAADEAHRCLGSACAGEDGSPRPVMSLAIALAHARLLRAHGDIAGARAVLAAARQGADGWRPPPLLRDWATVVDAELHLAEGRPVTALTALGDLPARCGPWAGPATVAAARAHLATGVPARAGSMLGALHRAGVALGLGARVEARLVEALAADRRGHEGAVTIALAEALAAAVPMAVVEPFLTANGDVAALLARHRDLLDAHRDIADRLGAVPAARTGPVVEPITEREGVVLRYLPTLLTMNEIAGELSVSPNTIKSHLRSVYRKLEVSSRRAAVHRARALGLL